MKKLNKNNFSSWKEYYFEYQKSLAEHYYIPFFQKNKIELENKHILEIGCGNGGFINAFGRFSDNCVGFDLKNLQWEKTNVKYHKLDVFDDDLINKIDSKFDIIILRDVVEHLDNSQPLSTPFGVMDYQEIAGLGFGTGVVVLASISP